MDKSGTNAFIVVIMVAALFAGLGLLNSCGGVGDAPPPPSGFSLLAPVDMATGVSSSPTLTWTDAVGETGYTVLISTSPTFTNNYFSWTLSANTTSYLVSWSAVTTGVQYYWQVLATNNWGTTKALNAPFRFTP